MTLYTSEKNFLERLADRIPGVAGYRDREARRDTDKRLREHLSRRLDRAREALDGARRAATDRGELGLLDTIGRLDRRARRASDSLRHASYGYSGAFDQVKMREEELDRIYRFDMDLIDVVDAVEGGLQGLAGGPAPEAVEAAAAQVDRLLERIAERQEIFERPAGESAHGG